MKLRAIPKPKSATTLFENDNIGVFYTETFIDPDGIYKIHALGFKSKLEDDCVMYYINDS
jgi:hypothetical protein